MSTSPNTSKKHIGFSATLHDWNIPWLKRLKLVRYAWANDSVLLSNKHQFLLDLLTAAVCGKREIVREDLLAIWQCLRDILRTAECQADSHNAGHACSVKSNFIQLLLDELSRLAASADVDKSLCELIISCCLALVTSPVLGYGLTSKFENTLRLLTSVLVLLVRFKSFPADLVALLSASLPHYASCQRQKASSQQVITQVSSKLLVPFLSFIYYMKSNGSSQLEGLVTDLENVLTESLFPKYLLMHYSQYLKRKVEKTEIGWKESRFISGAFDVLLSSLQAEEARPAVLNGVPWFYSKFTASYRTDDASLPLLFLRYLTRVVSLVDDSASTSDVTAKKNEATWSVVGQSLIADRLNVLQHLFETTQAMNVYSPSTDAQQDYKTQAWLSSVVMWMLDQDSRCSSWFESLRGILALTPGAVEDHLEAVLRNSLTADCRSCVADERSQDALLTEFVHVYVQLRQVNKLVAALLHCTRRADGRVFFPELFRASLSSCFTDLPQTIVVEIWSAINTELATTYNKDSQQCYFNSSQLAATCRLISIFIANVSVTGHFVTQQVEAKVETLLRATCEHVLALLYVVCIKQKCKEESVAVLQLLHVCGELLRLHQTYRLPAGAETSDKDVAERNFPCEFTDLSSVFPGWNHRRWDKLHRFVVSSSHGELILNWEKLLVQRMKFDQNLVTLECNVEQSTRLATDFILLGTHWDLDWTEAFKMRTFPGDSSVAGHWSLVCENVGLFFSQNDVVTRQIQVLADFVLFALTSQRSSLSDESLSICRVADVFKCSPVFYEMRALHACVVSSVISHVSRLIVGSSTTRSKKRRHSAHVDVTTRILSVIVATDDQSMSDVDGTKWMPDELVSLLNGLLDENVETADSSSSLDSSVESQIINYLKALETLPLEYLAVPNQIKCILSMLTVAGFASMSDLPDSTPSGLLAPSLRILRLALSDGGGLRLLLSVLDPGSFLGWFTSIYRRTVVRHASCAELIGACDDVFRCLLLASMKHSTTIEHLHAFVHKILIWLREHRKSDAEISPTTFGILTTMVDVITKVLRRAYIRPENRATLASLNDYLFREFLKSLAALYNETPAENGGDDTSNGATSLSNATSLRRGGSAVVSQMLLGFSRQLEYVLLHRKLTESSVGSTDRLHGKILAWLPTLCETCLDILRRTREFEFTRSGCLRFVVSLCSCHSSLSDRLPAGFLADVWPLLILRLRNIGLESCSSLRLGDSSRPANDKSDDVAAERRDLQITLAAILRVSDAEQFEHRLQELLSDMESNESVKTVSAQRVYQQLIVVGVANNVINLFYYSCQKVLLILCRLLSGDENDPVVIATSFQTLTAIVSNLSSSFLTAHELSLCLHVFPAVTPTEPSADFDRFTVISRSLHSLLNAILVYHPETVFHLIPSFAGGTKQLLRAVVRGGTQPADAQKRLTDFQLDQAVDCARLFDRLVSLMCSHKVDFAKAAPYIIAEYASLAQKVALYPVVKRALLLAIYKLLDVCSEHTIRQLNAVLPAGAREIFRIVYAEFDKYYRYSRRAVDQEQINSDFLQCMYNG